MNFSNPSTIQPPDSHRETTTREAQPASCSGCGRYHISRFSIKAKREGYGPIGNGGNGLILHYSSYRARNGQSLGLLWQKLWHQQPKAKPPANETPKQKKPVREPNAVARSKPFELKELSVGQALKQ